MKELAPLWLACRLRHMLLHENHRLLPAMLHSVQGLTAFYSRNVPAAENPTMSATAVARPRLFTDVWIATRRAPTDYEQTNHAEAQFIEGVLAGLPQYSVYLLTKSAQAIAADNNVTASHVTAALERFAACRENRDWTRAFDCLDAIVGLPFAKQESLVIGPGFASAAFANLVDYICTNMGALTSSEYRRLVKLIARLRLHYLPPKCKPEIASHERQQSAVSLKFKLAHHLIGEHSRRMSTWNAADLFFHSDVFNAMFVINSDSLLREYLAKMMSAAERLVAGDDPSVEALVTAAYFAACIRQAPPKLMNAVERGLVKQLFALSPEELAIVSLGFFRSQHKFVHRGLICKLLNTAEGLFRDGGHAPANSAVSFIASSIIKQCSYSVNKVQASMHDSLRCAILRCYAVVMPSVTLFAAARCLQSMVVMRHVSWPAVEAFAREQLATGQSGAGGVREVSGWRLKEVALVLFGLGSLQYNAVGSAELYAHLLADLSSQSRLSELHSHPRRLVTALLGLSYLNLYPHAIYEWLLRKDFLKFARRYLGGDEVGLLYRLNESIKLDDPTYSGPLLYPEQFTTLDRPRAKMEGGVKSAESLLPLEATMEVTRRTAIMKIIEGFVIDLLPVHYETRVHKLLPHLGSADIEIAPISSSLPRQKRALVMLSEFCYLKVYDDVDALTRPSLMLSGLHVTKLRHLKAAGFAVAQVPFYEFEEASDKKAYIKHVLKQVAL